MKTKASKSPFLIIPIILIALTPLFAQEGYPALARSSLSDFSRDKPLKIVYPVVMGPFTLEDENGEAQGIAIDLLRLWSKKTGIPIEFEGAIWDETLQAMRDGKADIHPSLYFTEERDKYLDYATVIAPSKGAIFYRKNIANINGPEDLMGYRIGVVQGGYHEKYIKEKLPDAAIVSYIEFPPMVDAAQKGDIHVFIDELYSVLYGLGKRGLLDTYHYNPDHALYRNNIWIAARKGDKDLLNALKDGMALITPEERASIEHKWMPVSTVRRADTLFIAMYSDFAPYTFLNVEGKPAGLFVDIWNLWAKKTGKKIEIIPSNWKNSLNNIKTGQADIHSGLFYSDSRAQWLDYAQSFYETGSCFFYSGDQKERYKDGVYAGKKVGVIKGSYNEEHLRKEHPTVDVVLFASMEKMLRAVLNGGISACLTEYASATALINRLGLSGMFNTEDPMHFRQKFHAVVLKGNKELLSLVKKGFETITNNELAEIEKHWVTNPENQYYSRLAERVLLTDEERAWLDAHPNITLGYTDAFEPEVIVNPDGSLQGILVDILAELNKRLETNIRIQIDPIPEVIEKAQKKEIDGILSIHPEYADKLGLLKTSSYFTGYPAIFARKNMAFNSVSDFSGKRVAVIDKVFFSEKMIEQYGSNAIIVKVADAKEGLSLVNNGQVDYFLGASLNSYFLNKYQLFDLMTQYVFYDHPINEVIATRSDWPELSSILDKGLSSFSEEEIVAIVEKWSHSPKKQKTIELTAKEQVWLAQNHTVRARIGNFPPYMIFKEDEITGIVIDYLNLIGQRSGLRFEFVSETRSWQEALKSLMDLQGPDLMTSLSPMAEREPYMDFSKPYIVSSRVIFTRTDAEFISSIDDLSGKTLAVPYGTLVHKRIEKGYPDIGLRLYDTDLKSIEAVSTGRADAYIGNLINTSYEIILKGFTNLKVVAPTPFGDDVYTFGIRRDWPELSSIINKALDTITPAERMAILKRYLSIKYEHGISSKDVLNWGLGFGGGAFLIILLIVFWNRSLKKQVDVRTAESDSINKSLEAEITERKQKEHQLEEYQHRLKALASQLTIAEERERRSLAADLHDHVGHSLALARMQLNGILEAQSELERNMLVKDVSHILLKSLQDTRSLIFELSSPTLNEIGLGAAISEWLEERMGKRYGLKTEFIDEIDEKLRKTLDDNVRAVLFRNVRELLTNVVKHARAHHVRVHLTEEAIEVKIVVEDDGVGFDFDPASRGEKQERGFGLFSIQERMADLGGSFEIQSAPGKGCRAILTAPVGDGKE